MRQASAARSDLASDVASAFRAAAICSAVVVPQDAAVAADDVGAASFAAKTGWLANRPKVKTTDRSLEMESRRDTLLRLAPAMSGAECA